MTLVTLSRFLGVIVILGLMAVLWPGLRWGFVDVLMLAVILSLADWMMSRVMGKTFSAKFGGVVGWLSAVVVLYAISWLIPGARMSALAALTAGTVLWAIGRFFPAVYG
ncbi:hypothetical protein [Sulfobacillus harzensis]|uniref:Phage holin family protein n=1 Tax=Sulfobacillus harzensis TaxID=2729629 RepID=A0A7Y0L3H4_9FIRM|nr:hypothetical protein [Sulfobacillus harzensis]NMP21204.1 hypothetical protein [Sulfobacillus harzensis]